MGNILLKQKMYYSIKELIGIIFAVSVSEQTIFFLVQFIRAVFPKDIMLEQSVSLHFLRAS